MARKRKSKPTSKARARKQTVKNRYAHAREDAQLLGLIVTSPEEALEDERVDPSSQSEQPLPGLIGQAIRKGWAVPEERKPRLVDELVSIMVDPEIPAVPKVMAYNALIKGDAVQHERDHPREAQAGPGTQINVNVGVKVNPFEAYKQHCEIEERINEQVKKETTDEASNG